jgi:hypothetical protein
MTLDSAPHFQVVTFIRGEVVRADEQKDEPRALEVPVDDGSPMLASADLICGPDSNKAVALEVGKMGFEGSTRRVVGFVIRDENFDRHLAPGKSRCFGVAERVANEGRGYRKKALERKIRTGLQATVHHEKAWNRDHRGQTPSDPPSAGQDTAWPRSARSRTLKAYSRT